MQALSFSLGAVTFTLFTIIRAVFDGQHVGLSTKSLGHAFGIPSKDDENGILMVTGQLMGILWIAIGFVLTKLKDWNEFGWGQIVIEFLLLISPFIVAQGVIWWLKKKQENKREP
jgi:hypothetical protein